jgi:gliding motility-associated-like protein
MKLILTSVFALLLSLGYTQITKIEYETEHVKHEGHDHPGDGHGLSRVDMLKGFDMAAARAEFNSYNLPENEWFGWLNYQQQVYMTTMFPDVFVNKDKDKKYDVPAKTDGCPNAGFEDLVFAPQWTGGTSLYGDPYTNTNIVSNGLNAAFNDNLSRHTILTVPPGNNNPFFGTIVGYDPIAINPGTGLSEIPFLAPFGGAASVRLGNAATGAQIERLRYTINVTPDNKAFYYQFAVVLQNPSGHAINAQPYFRIKFTDVNGVQVGGPCGLYNIVSSGAATDPSFIQFTYAGETAYYRKWERINVDLSPYIGQNITVEFESADCDLSGHFGYAYVDAGCLDNIDAVVNYCAGDLAAQLVAEPGFASYQWYDPNGLAIGGATNDTLLVATPNLGDTFTVHIATANGCILIQNVVIAYSQVDLDDIYTTPSCFGASAGTALITATGSGSGYTFTWTGPQNGTNTTGIVNNLLPGTYNLNIASGNPNCGTIDTTFIVPITNFIIPAQVDAKFCEGVGTIVGPPSTDYQWYDNNQNPIPAPAGTSSTITDINAFQGENYYLIYQLPSGCYDSIIYTFVDNKNNSDFTLGQPAGCRSMQITYNDLSFLSDSVNFNIQGPNGLNLTYFDTTGNIFNFTNLDTGTYDVRIIDEGCFYDTTFTITDLSDTSNYYFNFCPNDAYNLQSLATGIHQWTDPNGNVIGTNQTQIISNIIEGPYIDSCQVGPGCYWVSTFYLDSIYLTAAYNVDQPGCYGGSDGSITGSVVTGIPGTASYNAVGPNGYVSNNQNPMTGVSAGTYYITVSILGCSNIDTVFVGQPPVPSDTLTIYTETCNDLDQGVLYAPDGFFNYQWYYNGSPIQNQTEDSIVIILPTDIFAYSVTYTSPVDGCTKLTNKLSAEAFTFNYLPTEFNNVFTPNGDELNALYYPVHDLNLSTLEIAELAGEYKLTIFNRWGNVVFTTNNYLEGWNGTNKGNPVEDGTYFAEIQYRTKCATTEPLKLVQVIQVVR